MTIAVNTFIDTCELLLKDSANDRWTAAQLITYLNAGKDDICTRTGVIGMRPANVTTTNVVLVAGPKQTVPTGCIHLLDITRNMGRKWVTGTKYYEDEIVINSADGARYIVDSTHTSAAVITTDISAGRLVASPLGTEKAIERMENANLQQLLGNFYGGEPDSDLSLVDYWSPHIQDRDTFYIYPPQPNTVHLQYVEMVYSALAADMTAGGNLTLADHYQNALRSYVLFMAFLMDDDQEESAAKAERYFQLYSSDPVLGLR
jgi:hypothetical protein